MDVPAQKDQHRAFVIDGQNFFNLEEFCDEFNRIVLATQQHKWNGNFDAFNDFLSWPPAPHALEWCRSRLSRERLGHEEAARRFERLLHTCHPSNRPSIADDLARARRGEGPTLFDQIVEIFEENAEFVTLRLR